MILGRVSGQIQERASHWKKVRMGFGFKVPVWASGGLDNLRYTQRLNPSVYVCFVAVQLPARLKSVTCRGICKGTADAIYTA